MLRCVCGAAGSVAALRSQCQCGCTLTESTGHIIASARQRCGTTVRRWTILIKPQFTITLSVDYLRLSGLSSVRVYDSVTSTAAAPSHMPLLLTLTDTQHDDDATETVTTSGNRMLIEYIAVDNDVSVIRSNDGFIASYVTTRQFTGFTHHTLEKHLRVLLVYEACQLSSLVVRTYRHLSTTKLFAVNMASIDVCTRCIQ